MGFRSFLGRTWGKGVEVKDTTKEVMRKHVENAGLAGLALATPWREKSRLHLTEHAFDWVIWIGLAYYLFDRYLWGFQPTVFKFWINFIIAIFILTITFGKGVLVVATSVLLMVLWGSAIQGIAGFGFSYVSSDMITAVAVITALAYGIARWKGADVQGVLAVLIFFFLQTDILTLAIAFLPGLVTSPSTNWLFLPEFWPYWFILGIWYGHRTERTSKVASFFTIVFILFFFFSFVQMAYVSGGFGFFGQETLLKNRAALEERSKELEESRTRNIGIVAAPATCLFDVLINPKKYDGYYDCVEAKQNPPPPPSEEDLLRASKKDKRPRIFLFFINNDEGKRVDNLENAPESIGKVRIEATLTGEAQADKNVLLSCSINNGGNVTPAETVAEQGAAWKETVSCLPTAPLKKGSNEIVFRARWAQLAESDYPVYFMGKEALDSILEREFSWLPYLNARSACKGQPLCLRDLQRDVYRRIPEFKKMFADNPGWNMESRYDPEAAALLIGTEFPPIIPLAVGQELDFRLKVANLNPEGRITAIKSVRITMPDWMEPAEGCTLLEKAGDYYGVPEENLQADWSSVLASPGLKTQKDVPGLCRLKVMKISDEYPDLSTLSPVVFRATMDFDYELRTEFIVRQG